MINSSEEETKDETCTEDQKPLTYLACPYSDDDREVRLARFDAVNRVASELMRQGLHIFSPISHTHPILESGGLPCGWDYWAAYDRAVLSVCNKLIVLKLDGWERSIGVTAEVQIAVEMGLPIEYLEPAERR